MSCSEPIEQDVLSSLLQRGLDDGVYEGAVAAIGTGTSEPVISAVGSPTTERTGSVTASTRFDAASLTKPVVTTTIALRLYEQGQLDLDEQLSTYIPATERTPRGEIPVRTLLTHTSGLPPYKSFPFGWDSKDDLLESLYNSPLGLLAEPGDLFVYSDLNFVFLADALRHITGQSLADLAQQHVFEPIGMTDAAMGPIDGEDIAATKDRRWRGRILRGEIHDYMGAVMDGDGGNAGLFVTINDLIRIGKLILNDGTVDGTQVLSPSTVSLLRRDANNSLDQPHGLGWRISSGDQPSRAWSRTAIGHTGFTGTSLWIDDERDCYAALLTNRLLTDPSGEAIEAYRRRFHDVVMARVTETITDEINHE